MNVWENAVITVKGLSLLAKLVEGNTLAITKAETGEGYVTPGLLSQQTSVLAPKQTLTFRGVSYPEDGRCKLTCFLTNDDLATGYTASQVGIYANDPNEGEILFCIMQAISGKGADIPSKLEMPGFSSEWAVYFKYGQADGVTITVDPSGAVSQEYVDEELKKKANVDLSNISNPEAARNKLGAVGVVDLETTVERTAYTWPNLGEPNQMVYGNGVFVVSTDNNIYYSKDFGKTWNSCIPGIDVNSFAVNENWRMAYGNETFVASNSIGEIFVSENGITWDFTTSMTTIEKLVFTGGLFVGWVTGEDQLDNSEYFDVIWSKDGYTWGHENVYGSVKPSTAAVITEYENDGPVSVIGFYSADNPAKMVYFEAAGTDNPGYDEHNVTGLEAGIVSFLDESAYGSLLALTPAALYHSTDGGYTWAVTSRLPEGTWSEVVYGDGRYFIIDSTNNNIAYSSDLKHWEVESLGGATGLKDVAYGNRRFVIVDETAYWIYQAGNAYDLMKFEDVPQYLKENGKSSREAIGAAPNYSYGTTDLTAGSTPLKTGKLHFVYE